MFKEQKYYVRNEIQKTFKMGILEYSEWIHAMFEIVKLPPPPNKKNEENHEATWDTREITYKGEIIRKSTNNGLPTTIQEDFEEKDREYHALPTK